MEGEVWTDKLRGRGKHEKGREAKEIFHPCFLLRTRQTIEMEGSPWWHGEQEPTHAWVTITTEALS